jgi:hypothetical protein
MENIQVRGCQLFNTGNQTFFKLDVPTGIFISCGHVARDFESKAKTNKLGVIHFSKISKLTMCRASEAWKIYSFKNQVCKV